MSSISLLLISFGLLAGQSLAENPGKNNRCARAFQKLTPLDEYVEKKLLAGEVPDVPTILRATSSGVNSEEELAEFIGEQSLNNYLKDQVKRIRVKLDRSLGELLTERNLGSTLQNLNLVFEGQFPFKEKYGESFSFLFPKFSSLTPKKQLSMVLKKAHGRDAFLAEEVRENIREGFFEAYVANAKSLGTLPTTMDELALYLSVDPALLDYVAGKNRLLPGIRELRAVTLSRVFKGDATKLLGQLKKVKDTRYEDPDYVKSINEELKTKRGFLSMAAEGGRLVNPEVYVLLKEIGKDFDLQLRVSVLEGQTAIIDPFLHQQAEDGKIAISNFTTVVNKQAKSFEPIIHAKRLNPLSGLKKHYGNGVNIVPHLQVAAETLPAGDNRLETRQAFSTGGITFSDFRNKKRNISSVQLKTNYQAEDLSIYGAVAVRFEGIPVVEGRKMSPQNNVQQLIFNEKDRSITYGGYTYYAHLQNSGEVKVTRKKMDVSFMNLFDIHSAKQNQQLKSDMLELAKRYKPRYILVDDGFDSYTMSHHIFRDYMETNRAHTRSELNPADEIRELQQSIMAEMDYLNEGRKKDDYVRYIFKASNHNDFMTRVQKSGNFNQFNEHWRKVFLDAQEMGKEPLEYILRYGAPEHGIRALPEEYLDFIDFLAYDDYLELHGNVLHNHGDKSPSPFSRYAPNPKRLAEIFNQAGFSGHLHNTLTRIVVRLDDGTLLDWVAGGSSMNPASYVPTTMGASRTATIAFTLSNGTTVVYQSVRGPNGQTFIPVDNSMVDPEDLSPEGHPYTPEHHNKQRKSPFEGSGDQHSMGH